MRLADDRECYEHSGLRRSRPVYELNRGHDGGTRHREVNERPEAMVGWSDGAIIWKVGVFSTGPAFFLLPTFCIIEQSNWAMDARCAVYFYNVEYSNRSEHATDARARK